MLKVPSIIVALLISAHLSGQSPHGEALKISCNVCHTTENWKVKEKGFNHNTTSFKLDGQHKDVSCRACHPTLVFTDAKSDCASCHKDIHQGTVGQDCDRCHNTTSWMVGNITEIHRLTRFPLNGGHAGVDCNQCHKLGSRLRFDPMSTECVSCHLKDYNATTNPAHATAQFPTDCKMCHNEADWKSATFDHNTTTSFPLKGGHIGLSCIQCHSQGFVGTSTACASCHQKDYNATTNPTHSAAGFSTDCQNCHTDAAWKPSSFNHNTATSFPLNGGHKTLTCNQCHTQGFAGTATACVSCHLKDYNATTNPAHATAQFPTDCKLCHSEVDWSTATFDHNTRTSFPLKGGHLGLTCTQCHTQGFVGTSTACVSCHLKDYNATTNPSHTLAKFSSDCQTCHTDAAWKPSTFNHNTATSFALTGSHKTVTCNLCHTQGYAGISTTCVSCHLKEYNATTNPAHAIAKFPTNCETCHTTTVWTTSTFNHDSQYFPIYSGNHRGEWTTCIQCHTNPANFAVFSCLTCHEHNKTSMDSEHQGRSGYVYNSTNCYSCHPRGNS